jgi:endonuclease/exonuclease/phosphatase family metal-dependent hydrolase
MKVVSWNLNFWSNWRKEKKDEWKNSVLRYIDTLDYDFLLLQEINANYLFDGEEHLHLVYYQELGLDEIGAANSKEVFSWGNAIVVNKKHFIDGKYSNKQFKPKLIDNDYCGRSILMFYDFSLPSGKTISLINFYGKKAPSGGYPILTHSISDMKSFVEEHDDNRLIVLAGDFNCDPIKLPEYKKIFFDKLEAMGFANCTIDKNFENTMVPGARPWPNDKVFVKKPYHEVVKCKLLKDTNLELSDHMPIECIIDI